MAESDTYDADKLTPLIRSAILSAPCLILSLSVIAFAAVLTPGGLMVGLSLWLRILVLLIALVVYLAWSYAFLPPLIFLARRKGWPLIATQIGLYVPLAVFTAPVLPALEGGGFEATRIGWTLAASLSLIILSCILGALLLQTQVLPGSGITVTPRALWLGEALQTATDDWLPPALRGRRVLRMQTEDNYVHVTTAGGGEDLVRMSLSDASVQLGQETGLRIHRGHWVAWSELSSLRYDKGNPRAVLTDGSILPVSRSAVESIKRALKER